MKFRQNSFHCILLTSIVLFNVPSAMGKQSEAADDKKIPVIFDTDANNEVDDQFALAYLLFSGDVFDVVGVTANATCPPGGGLTYSHVTEHYMEAKRVMQLCGLHGKIPLHAGATGSFVAIRDHVKAPKFDGSEAVDFIIEESLKDRDRTLVLLAVGKLTNVALALKKEPAIAKKVRVLWLGSSYPQSREHNLVWDIGALNYVLDTGVPLEIATVRYREPSGTGAVRVSRDQVYHRLPGLGPKVSPAVEGRHGGEFSHWGDYAVNLFQQFDMTGDPPGRPLFDQAAVAILKNPEWAESRVIPAPTYSEADDKWIERPDNEHTITIREWFDIYAIINDFFRTMEHPVLAEP